MFNQSLINLWADSQEVNNLLLVQKACPPGLRDLLIPFGVTAALEFRQGARSRPLGTSRNQQGSLQTGGVFFNHAVFLPLFLPHLLSLPPSAPLRRSLSRVLVVFFDILRFRMRRKLSRDIRMHAGYTQTSTKARPLKALREQKRRVVVCGLIALAAWNNGAGRE